MFSLKVGDVRYHKKEQPPHRSVGVKERSKDWVWLCRLTKLIDKDQKVCNVNDSIAVKIKQIIEF